MSDIEFELEVRFVSIHLQRTHGDDLSAIERSDKFHPADPKLTLAGLDLVILHPA